MIKDYDIEKIIMLIDNNMSDDNDNNMSNDNNDNMSNNNNDNNNMSDDNDNNMSNEENEEKISPEQNDKINNLQKKLDTIKSKKTPKIKSDHVKIPECLINKRIIINPQTNDNKSFMDAVTLSLYCKGIGKIILDQKLLESIVILLIGKILTFHLQVKTINN